MKKILGLLGLSSSLFASEASLRLELWQLWQEGSLNTQQYYEILQFAEKPHTACQLISYYSVKEIYSCAPDSSLGLNLGYQRHLRLDSGETYGQKIKLHTQGSRLQTQIAWDLDSNLLLDRSLHLESQHWDLWLGEELGQSENTGIDFRPSAPLGKKSQGLWYQGRPGQLNGMALAYGFKHGRIYSLGTWNHSQGSQSPLDTRLWGLWFQTMNWQLGAMHEQIQQKNFYYAHLRWSDTTRQLRTQWDPYHFSAALEGKWKFKAPHFQSHTQFHWQSSNYLSSYDPWNASTPKDTSDLGLLPPVAHSWLAQRWSYEFHGLEWKQSHTWLNTPTLIRWQGQGELSTPGKLKALGQLRWQGKADTLSSDLGLRTQMEEHHLECKQRTWQKKLGSSQLSYPSQCSYTFQSTPYQFQWILKSSEWLWTDRQSNWSLSHTLRLPGGADFRALLSWDLGGWSQIHHPLSLLSLEAHF